MNAGRLMRDWGLHRVRGGAVRTVLSVTYARTVGARTEATLPIR